MTWGEFAGAVSLPTILAALFAYLGKISAERFARKEQAELTEKPRALEADYNTSADARKAMYSLELDNYQKVWHIPRLTASIHF